MGIRLSITLGEDLSLKQATTIGETLKGELGIHSMSFGSSVGQPVIRGQSGVRVQVLQNGLSSLDASGVSPDHANSTEALLAERICKGTETITGSNSCIPSAITRHEVLSMKSK
jgi:iron complex outermembrane receptor protein